MTFGHQLNAEDLIEQFEEKWRKGERPNWRQFLPPQNSADFGRVLLELAIRDIQHRLRVGDHPPFAEDYWGVPGANWTEKQQAQLLFEEYQGRWDRGDLTTRCEEFQRRFPALADELSSLRPKWECPHCGCDNEMASEEDSSVACARCTQNFQVADLFRAMPEKLGNSLQIGGYELQGELGKGGMGVVYKAKDKDLPRFVALKMILQADRATADEMSRFHQEAEAIAQLQHPNIVEIFAKGKHEGKPFLVLEFCEGGSLEDVLKKRAVPPSEGAELVETLARAIQVAHEAGIWHRDLKPANILLTKARTPKITDFGLAKCFGKEGLSITGAIMGTPSYMAPEQASGESHRIGPLTDVWALGTILYELFTGQKAFPGSNSLSVIYNVAMEEPVSPRTLNPHLPKQLEAICLKCLCKDPAERYTSAESLADDLRSWNRGRETLNQNNEDSSYGENELAELAPKQTSDNQVGVETEDFSNQDHTLPPFSVASKLNETNQKTPQSKTRRRIWVWPCLAMSVLGGIGLVVFLCWDQTENIKGEIDIRVWKGNRSGEGRLLHQAGVLPLQAGDFVQVKSELSTGPAYLYVVWLEASGNVVPLYPWKKQNWDQRPDDEQPVPELVFPQTPLSSGPSGVEGMVLMVRPTKLPKGADRKLQAVFAQWKKQTSPGDPHYRFWLENGRIVSEETNRGAPNFERLPDDPVTQVQQLMKGPLAEWFPYTRAVCYSFQSKITSP